MKLYHTRKGLLLESEEAYYLLEQDWDGLLNTENLFAALVAICESTAPIENYREILEKDVLPPVKSQEIWASGVTYFNSKMERQKESEKAGGGIFYEMVYHAERPELFFKSTPQRAIGSGQKVRIRKDSTWDVPEPELTLVINNNAQIVGYTIGNDMSSRSIEGENPLYLTQAKVYDGSAAVGPCVLVTAEPFSLERAISLTIFRKGATVFHESILLSQMKRTPEDLVSYLYRECSFPLGCLLMTGTGIIPSTDFTLQSQDEIHIHIEGIGTLINEVA
ncbi:MAG TPA: fumarylacetoacetate hydrolase family protein [Saprospiraceae bacterium]|nr:fumarylacetoacetate hydrolase family protein [Saprospiraceae bacterium]HMQ81449.1 fumarylacetoacetate hydrolase family protein [Saprospiraceae bacterium]